MNEIEFQGLYSLEADERTPFDRAILADDCFLDTGCPVGRTGYKAASAAIGAAADVPKGIVRYRPSSTSARTVVAQKVDSSNRIGIYTTTDPSDPASDGVNATINASVFPGASNVVMAQLHKFLYIGSDATDQNADPWRRLKTDFTLQDLLSLPQGTKPTSAKTSPSWFVYRTEVAGGGASTAVVNCALSTTVSGLLATWYGVVGTTGDSSDPLDGSTVKVTLTTAVNISGADWLAVALSPPDSGKGGKHVIISISEDDSTYYPLGTIYDTTGQAGSPNIILCSLKNLTDAQRNAFKYIKFELKNINDDANALRWALYGHMVLYGRDESPVNYYVTFYDSTSEQESPPTEALVVDITDTDVNGPPPYTNQYLDSDSYNSSAANMGPLDVANPRIFNRFAIPALPMPTLQTLGALVTVSGNAIAFAGGGSLTARLWKDTENGRRLIDTASVTTGAAYSLVDRGSDSVLAAVKWRPGGPPPQTNALASFAGRLIAGYDNRVYISSFVPPDKTTDPFPQWPPIATEDSDGWSFDIGSSKADQIQSIISGDIVYIITQQNVYGMSDLTPVFDGNADSFFHIFSRGSISKQGPLYAEDTLFVPAWDGVYAFQGRTQPQELTKEIRDDYRTWLAPSSNTFIGYQDRKLFIVNGTKMLRFDFITNTWTRHTLTDTPRYCAVFTNPGESKQRFWMLTTGREIQRWDSTYSDDDGGVIPNWTYQTGYLVGGKGFRFESIYLDVNGPLELRIYKDATNFRHSMRPKGEHYYDSPNDFSGYKMSLYFNANRGTTLRRAMFSALEQKAGQPT